MAKKNFIGRTRAERDLQDMTYKQLKLACIARGMNPELVYSGDHSSLSTYFILHYDNPVDKTRIGIFEDSVDSILAEKYEATDPIRLFRISHQQNAEGDIKVNKKALKAAGVKTKKPKREKDTQFKVYTGTKKHLTYSLADKGLALKEVLEQVLQAFPEANERSVTIWYKRALAAKKIIKSSESFQDGKKAMAKK